MSKIVFALVAVLFVSYAQTSPVARDPPVTIEVVKHALVSQWDDFTNLLKEKFQNYKNKFNEIKNEGILVASIILDRAVQEVAQKYPEFADLISESFPEPTTNGFNGYDIDYALSTILQFNKNVYDKLKPELNKVRKEVDEMVLLAIESAHYRDDENLDKVSKKLEESKERMDHLLNSAVESIKPKLSASDAKKLEMAVQSANDTVFETFEKLNNTLKSIVHFVYMKMHEGRTAILG